MAETTVIVSARMSAELERKAALLAALRGQHRQAVVISALERELATAPERAEVQRLAATYARRGPSEGVKV